MILAHAFGVRYDLPVPLTLFILGGAAAVVLSFLLVFRRDVIPSEEAVPPAVVADGRFQAHPLGIGVGALLLAGLVACGLVGSQTVAENLLPVTFWLLIWIAVPLSCAVVGDWTRHLNPFAALGRAGDNAALRERVLGGGKPLPWPEILGWWPAVVAYFAAACGELVFNLTATVPHVLALGLVVYGVLCLAGGFFFGPAWGTYGEMFSVLYATWGRLGYWRWRTKGRRGFGGGLEVPFEPVPSRVIFVLLLLVSVNFDGLLATPSWSRLELNMSGNVQLFRVGAFAALLLLITLVFGAFAVWSYREGGMATTAVRALSGLLPSLVPIAFGYLLAHNLQYVLINGQLLFPLLGNPAGLDHWPHFPYPFNDSYELNVHLLSSAFYWYASVLVIVAAHVVAVVLAHRHLSSRATDRRRAIRSELPWLLAMVGYTMFSLWLIAQPLAK